MSRLKELRLHGFKSFADPTRFVFQPGVNAVIGPNGSGKSNMADAVRWVMGEQSNRFLRTRRAEDVIFAGSQSRKPQGLAEAILTLDNQDGWLPIDFAEVTIGRRAYRSGESEYLVNGAKARLRDVIELLGHGRLGATDLVVVGQGTVDAALSLRPEERRQLFEEAAGVKGLQVRKNEALARLARARDTLTRVTDLVGELKPQVRRLALQAQHQQQHDELLARGRALLTESHRRREAAARSSLGEARRRAAAAEAALEANRAEQDAGRDAVVAAEAAYWAAEAAARAAGERREATREARIRAESEASALAARVAELTDALAAAEEALAAARAELASLDDGSTNEEVDPALGEASRAEERWRRAIAALAEADTTLVDAEEQLADIRGRRSAAIATAARRGELRARVEARRETLERERSAVAATVAEARGWRDEAAEARDAAERALAAAREALRIAEAERDAADPIAETARHEASGLAEQVGVMRAELRALHERAEHGGRLGAVLSAAGWPSLLDAISAPEAAWPAIEAVVGGELELALLWRDGEITEHLLEARGAARLLAAGGVDDEARKAALDAVGGETTLAEWIGGDRLPALFQRTVVVRDVGRLLAGWRRLPAGWCAVTPDGDLADARGMVVLRGRDEPPGGAAARQHARRRELSDELDRREREQVAAGATAAQALARAASARRDVEAARERLAQATATAQSAAMELQAIESRLARATAEGERLTAELATLDVQLAERGIAIESPTHDADELGALERRAVDARRQRDAAAAERDAARDAWQATREAAQRLEQRVSGQRERRAGLVAEIARLEAGNPAHRAALEAAVAADAAAAARVESARSDDEAAGAAREAAEAEREARRTALLELERGSSGASAQLAELEREAQAAAIEASRLEEILGALGRERALAFESLDEATPADGPAADPTPKLLEEVGALDDQALDAEQRRIRRTLAQIGSVNPFAVDEHRELAARLEELTSQDEDLRAAIGATEELIATLEVEINERFSTAFSAIGERFDEFCRLLFAGGSGSLTLNEASDADAPGGIEIVVRPPGKRLQRLAMLSGGERALTGVALLFAMLTVNPVPFCILDEVDAALDEANIGRFADALRRLAEAIDFVVITHNRATIEVADTIYGVTMTDAAVSRLLSLRLSDLPAEVSA